MPRADSTDVSTSTPALQAVQLRQSARRLLFCPPALHHLAVSGCHLVMAPSGASLFHTWLLSASMYLLRLAA